ncbi:glycoside hydrolase family 27 protein [Diplodia corticola]|uniref:Alpha-galactosidase n=1 Tax=Diplodia corticola TaxID=236234 RepID=A0A1J9REU3_9PEZI|nr:glycoside hydrolase family 27 protein [Diplodia corticola]OJD38921.1 glycoside hydrolase family 27 protein [Diplodia corticola]
MLLAALALVLLKTSLLPVVDADTLRYGKTPNGFTAPARGWTSSALQSLSPASAGRLTLNQENVIKQCDAMRQELGAYGYEYCSLGAGWSLAASGDEHGRITYDPDAFDLPALADHLHGEGAKLGVYIVPGFFSADAGKTIEGTDVALSSIEADEDEPCRAMSRCNIDYSKPGAQEWCDSNVKQFADWGVDLIKLDYVTPGSPGAGADLSSDNSGSVACYHKAIQQSGREIRLHIGWELDQNATYYDIWRSNADALRTDRTPVNTNLTTLTDWPSIQRATERYRQWILPRLDSADELTIRPDLGDLMVGNAAALAGLTALQQRAALTHWIGAGSPLLLGTDMTALASSSSSSSDSSSDSSTQLLLAGLLRNPLANSIATQFTASHPMVPTLGNANLTHGRQRQIWLAGPDPTSGVVVVVLANYGAATATAAGVDDGPIYASADTDDNDNDNDTGSGSGSDGDQSAVFRLSPKDLGLASSGYYAVEDVWANATVDLGYDDAWTWTLDGGGDAALLRLTPSMTGGGDGNDSTDAAEAQQQQGQGQGKRDHHLLLMEQSQKALFVQYRDGNNDVLTSAGAASGRAGASSAEQTDSASDASAAGGGGTTASWGKVLLWVGAAGLQTAMLWLL